jgi:hypothetical protein
MTDHKSGLNPPKIASDLGLGFLSETSDIYLDIARVFEALGVDSKFKYTPNLIVSLQSSAVQPDWKSSS